MLQGLVIRCSVYSNVIDLPAKHCFCIKIIHNYYQIRKYTRVIFIIIRRYNWSKIITTLVINYYVN